MIDAAHPAPAAARPGLVAAGVDAAARRARAHRAALHRLGFAAGLAWAGGHSAACVARLAAAAGAPRRGPDPLALECARVLALARERDLPPCAASARAGFAAALAAVAERVRELDRPA